MTHINPILLPASGPWARITRENWGGSLLQFGSRPHSRLECRSREKLGHPVADLGVE